LGDAFEAEVVAEGGDMEAAIANIEAKLKAKL
jgi:hypothetical protein